MTAVRALLRARRREIAIGVTLLAVLYTFREAGDAGQFLNFTAIGVAEGCIFAIAAIGLVLTYATTGTFNFAHGAIGMAAGYLLYALSEQLGLPLLIAVVLVVGVIGPAMGLLIELVMRRFRDQPVTTSIVVTIALTIMLIGVFQYQFPPNEPAVLTQLLGQDNSVEIGAVSLTYDQVMHLLVAVGVAAALRVLLFGSRTGTAMRAVVDNPTLAALNGAKPVTIARISWMVGASLGALAGVFQATTFGGGLSQIDLTFFVVGAYGAAVIGRLKSLPLTFAGAIALGIAKNYAFLALPSTTVWNAVKQSIPAVFLFAALLLLPEAKLSVGRVVGRRAPAIPQSIAALLRAAAFVGGIFVVSRAAPDEYLGDVTRSLIFAALLLSLVVLTGLSGQVSLCQYVFVGLGAWAMGTFFGGDSLPGLLLAGLIAVPFGVLVALPALRLQGLYLALVTFAFAGAARTLVFDNPNVYGSENVNVGRLSIGPVDFGDNRSFIVLCGIVFALMGLGVLWIKRGPFGRRLVAMRDSQAACATLGLDLRRTKLTVFAVSAFIAGVAGALLGGLNANVSALTFEKENNLVLFLFAVVGGVTTVTGALIGGILFALLPLMQSKAPELGGLVFAGVAAAAIGLGKQPNGMAGLLFDRLESMGISTRRRKTAARPVAPSPDAAPARREAVGATA